MSYSSFKKTKHKKKAPAKDEKKLSSRTKSAILRSSSDAPSTSGSSKDTGSDLPEAKRRKTTGEDFGTTDAVAPARRTTFEIDERAGLPKMTTVKLLPRLRANVGKITGISFGRIRTPSPLIGGRMGDHTRSWTSVVDSVHARLYGKTLSAAAAELNAMQAHAQAWMNNEDAIGTKLWKMLDQTDQDRRHKVLEHYAFKVKDLLRQAGELLATPGSDGRVAELLAAATAHHLAFLNFLPFATVPAGDVGSRGSGEGTARAKVLDVELDVEAELQWAEYLEQESEEAKRERMEAEAAEEREKREKDGTPERTRDREAKELAEATAAKQRQLTNAHDGLWGLFSMEAAVRAADVERAVAPAKIAEHVKLLRRLQTLATDTRVLLSGFIVPEAEVNPETGTKRPRSAVQPDRGAIAEVFAIDIAVLQRTAGELKEATKGLPYREIQPLVTELNSALTTMKGWHTKVLVDDSKKIFEPIMGGLVDFSANLDKVVSRLSVAPEIARAESALLLANLLHEHQTAVAWTYPNAVEKTKFLGENPNENAKQVAAERVLAFINEEREGKKRIEGVEAGPAGELADKIIELYPLLGAAPTPGPNTRWVGDSRIASLVATFNGDTLSIQGRPPTPPGVGGMGSHTTAWVTEVNWMLKRVAKVAGKNEIVAELQKEAMTDLNGDLMTKLAHHLPADQLAAGQLGIIFDAALDVMAATEPVDAITAYLSFRNLLPYATVDAGDRGGHGERANAAKGIVFDDKSLRAAIVQKLGELGPGRLAGTITTLRAAADSLEQDYAASAEPEDVVMVDSDAEDADKADSDAEQPPLTWKSNAEMRKAITNTIKALRDEADRLELAPEPKAGVKATIENTRKAEHDEVHAYGNS